MAAGISSVINSRYQSLATGSDSTIEQSNLTFIPFLPEDNAWLNQTSAQGPSTTSSLSYSDEGSTSAVERSFAIDNLHSTLQDLHRLFDRIDPSSDSCISFLAHCAYNESLFSFIDSYLLYRTYPITSTTTSSSSSQQAQSKRSIKATAHSFDKLVFTLFAKLSSSEFDAGLQNSLKVFEYNRTHLKTKSTIVILNKAPASNSNSNSNSNSDSDKSQSQYQISVGQALGLIPFFTSVHILQLIRLFGYSNPDVCSSMLIALSKSKGGLLTDSPAKPINQIKKNPNTSSANINELDVELQLVFKEILKTFNDLSDICTAKLDNIVLSKANSKTNNTSNVNFSSSSTTGGKKSAITNVILNSKSSNPSQLSTKANIDLSPDDIVHLFEDSMVLLSNTVYTVLQSIHCTSSQAHSLDLVGLFLFMPFQQTSSSSASSNTTNYDDNSSIIEFSHCFSTLLEAFHFAFSTLIPALEMYLDRVDKNKKDSFAYNMIFIKLSLLHSIHMAIKSSLQLVLNPSTYSSLSNLLTTSSTGSPKTSTSYNNWIEYFEYAITSTSSASIDLNMNASSTSKSNGKKSSEYKALSSDASDIKISGGNLLCSLYIVYPDDVFNLLQSIGEASKSATEKARVEYIIMTLLSITAPESKINTSKSASNMAFLDKLSADLAALSTNINSSSSSASSNLNSTDDVAIKDLIAQRDKNISSKRADDTNHSNVVLERVLGIFPSLGKAYVNSLLVLYMKQKGLTKIGNGDVDAATEHVCNTCASQSDGADNALASAQSTSSSSSSFSSSSSSLLGTSGGGLPVQSAFSFNNSAFKINANVESIHRGKKNIEKELLQFNSKDYLDREKQRIQFAERQQYEDYRIIANVLSEYNDDYDDQYDESYSSVQSNKLKAGLSALDIEGDDYDDSKAPSASTTSIRNSKASLAMDARMRDMKRFNAMVKEEEEEQAFWESMKNTNRMVPVKGSVEDAEDEDDSTGGNNSNSNSNSNSRGGGNRGTPKPTLREGLAKKRGDSGGAEASKGNSNSNNSSNSNSNNSNSNSKNSNSNSNSNSYSGSGGGGDQKKFRTKTFDRHHQKDKSLKKMGGF